MTTFNLYHLKHRELIRLERSVRSLKPSTDEEIAKVEQIKQCVDAFDCLLNVSDLRKKNADYDAIWLKKREAAKTLLTQGWYSNIANITTRDLPQLIKLTSNGTYPWFDKANKKIELVERPWRETFSYDIVRFENQAFMYMSSGWINLSTGQFSGDML